MASDRWTIFARAVGKDGQGIEMKLIDASGDTDSTEQDYKAMWEASQDALTRQIERTTSLRSAVEKAVSEIRLREATHEQKAGYKGEHCFRAWSLGEAADLIDAALSEEAGRA